MNMPGFGDAATFGPIWHPSDPRRDDSAQEAFEADLCHAVETVEYHLVQIKVLIAKGDYNGAQAEFEKIAEVTL